MDRGTIARRYATALFKYACKQGKEESVYDTTVVLGYRYVEFPALKRVLDNPVLPAKEKEELIVLTAGRDLSDEFLRFVRLVIREKREEFLHMICLSYQEIYKREKNLLHVDIVTAIPVDGSMEKEIADRLETMTGKTVHVTSYVRPEIAGGYVMTWDTYRWDASVTTQLRQIKKELQNRVKME